MAEPGLQLEQRHRLLRVVQLSSDRRASAMAGDSAPRIFSRDTRLLAQCGNERLVQVARWDWAAAEAEGERDRFGGLGIDEERLCWALGLPGSDRIANQRIHGLGVASAGLVRWYVQQAGGTVVRQMVLGRSWGSTRSLPTNTADAKPYELVAAESGEQPGDDERPYQGQRIPARRWEVVSIEVNACPEQLGPDVVGDESRLWTDLGLYGARGSKNAIRVEPPGAPAPFLRVAKNSADGSEQADLVVRRDRLATRSEVPTARCTQIADGEVVDGGDVGEADLTVPIV